jgi:hypothetical protein
MCTSDAGDAQKSKMWMDVGEFVKLGVVVMHKNQRCGWMCVNLLSCCGGVVMNEAAAATATKAYSMGWCICQVLAAVVRRRGIN